MSKEQEHLEIESTIGNDDDDVVNFCFKSKKLTGMILQYL